VSERSSSARSVGQAEDARTSGRAPSDSAPIVREVRIDARPDTVFAFFVEPQKLVRWMGTTATLEARPGGVFRLEYGPGGAHGVVRGEFVAVDRPRRVVFTWGWEDPADPIQPGGSTVEVELEPDGDATLVRLRHSGLDAESRKSHEEGWTQFLPGLAEAATTEAGAD
jgi:uncharacterized protein YndB with AHSA1/START domain